MSLEHSTPGFHSPIVTPAKAGVHAGEKCGAAWGFVEGLRQQGRTQAFNLLHNLAQFDGDEPAAQSMYLDLIADFHDLPQLPEEVKAGFSFGQVNRDRLVYFAFDGEQSGQVHVAALVKPSGNPLQAVFLTLSARDAGEENRVIAQIVRRAQSSAALAAA